MPDSGELELERTFLAKYVPPEIRGVSPVGLADIYIPATGKPTMRLRQKGGAFEFTKKVPVDPSDSSVHIEQTIQLSKREFQALRKVSNRQLEKDRYCIQIDGQPAEVDVFKGPLAGLVLIDFEFSDMSAMQNFEPPECCLADVTQEEFVAGGYLASCSYQEVESELHRLGYRALTLTGF